MRIFNLLIFNLLIVTLGVGQTGFSTGIQMTLEDANGDPLNGSQTIEFHLYQGSEGNQVLWSETQILLAAEGLVSTTLGIQTTIPLTAASYDDLWLGLIVNGEEIPDRIRVNEVPKSANSRLLSGMTYQAIISSVHVTESAIDIAELVEVGSNTSQWIILNSVPVDLIENNRIIAFGETYIGNWAPNAWQGISPWFAIGLFDSNGDFIEWDNSSVMKGWVAEDDDMNSCSIRQMVSFATFEPVPGSYYVGFAIQDPGLLDFGGGYSGTVEVPKLLVMQAKKTNEDNSRQMTINGKVINSNISKVQNGKVDE